MDETVIDDEEAGAAELARLIAEAARVVGFTGAGISTECGVPDFRSPGSPWRRHPPLPHAEFMASEAARREAWRRKFAMDDVYAGAKPGRGHHALADLVRSGRLTGIITQNIEGLHQASGVPADRIVELHGNGTYAVCLDCGLPYALAPLRERFEAEGTAPICASCGGIVKSATIAFGQSMPEPAMRRARALAEGCDLFLAIGSSLVVQPAASFPLLAKRAGARLAILNRDPTPLDAVADLVVRADIGAVLARVIARVLAPGHAAA